MNNKVFIPVRGLGEAEAACLRKKAEEPCLFDRHGDPSLADRYGKFGFVSVVPQEKESKLRCFFRLLGCSQVYMPVKWHEEKCGRMAFTVAELLNKKVIFEEDGVCR